MQAMRKHPTAISRGCPTPPPPSASHLDVGLHRLHHLPYALLSSPLHTSSLYFQAKTHLLALSLVPQLSEPNQTSLVPVPCSTSGSWLLKLYILGTLLPSACHTRFWSSSRLRPFAPP